MGGGGGGGTTFALDCSGHVTSILGYTLERGGIITRTLCIVSAVLYMSICAGLDDSDNESSFSGSLL